jgi:hypothetical protein
MRRALLREIEGFRRQLRAQGLSANCLFYTDIKDQDRAPFNASASNINNGFATATNTTTADIPGTKSIGEASRRSVPILRGGLALDSDNSG